MKAGIVPPIIVQVPATTANLGPGFDSFGLALKCYNRFMVTPAETDMLTIATGTCTDVDGLPLEAGRNLFFKALRTFYQHINKPCPPIKVDMEIHIPLARGLGSSSTAIIGGLVAANALENNFLSRQELFEIANTLEGHPDNVSAALFGGVLLCDGIRVFPLNWPADWRVLLVIPPYHLLTETVRQVLPKAYTLQDAVFNLRKSSLLTYALLKADETAFRLSLQDMLHQPYRKSLIPEYDEVVELAHHLGAFGTVISGAGPTMAVFYPDRQATTLWEGFEDFKKTHVLDFNLWRLSIDYEGAKAETQS